MKIDIAKKGLSINKAIQEFEKAEDNNRERIIDLGKEIKEMPQSKEIKRLKTDNRKVGQNISKLIEEMRNLFK